MSSISDESASTHPSVPLFGKSRLTTTGPFAPAAAWWMCAAVESFRSAVLACSTTLISSLLTVRAALPDAALATAGFSLSPKRLVQITEILSVNNWPRTSPPGLAAL